MAYNGTYELYPMVAKPGTLALDVRCAGTTNGTNVQIYGVNGGNCQKFLISQVSSNSDQHLIQSALTSATKYLDVAGITPRPQANIQLWDRSNSRTQLWKITQVGTVNFNGVNCDVVIISIQTSDAVYAIDVADGLASFDTNVQLYTAHGGEAQQWIMVPTKVQLPSIPVPYSPANASFSGAPAFDPFAIAGNPFYRSWVASPAWTLGSGNFEVRQRTRLKEGSGWYVWSNWSDWSNWQTVATNTFPGAYEPRRHYTNNQTTHTYTWNQGDNMEVECQIRAVSGSYASNVASYTYNVYKVPNIIVNAAAWTPEGLRIGWTSDYSGTNYLNISKITFDGAIVFNGSAGDIVLEGYGTSGSGLIPADKLRKWPTSGQTAAITFIPGYDQCSKLATPYDTTMRTSFPDVSYDSGTTVIEPAFVSVGAKLIAVVRDLGTTRMWISFENSLVEAHEDKSYTVSSGYKAFDVPYPMRKAFSVYTSTANSSGSQWANDVTEHAAINRYANAWSWDGGSAYLIYTPDRPSIGTSYELVYTADVLDGRKHEGVQFSGAIRVKKEVSGDLLPNDTSTIKDFQALMDAGHAVFRSMNGELFDVAITAVNMTEVNNSYTEVSVSMIVETI